MPKKNKQLIIGLILVLVYVGVFYLFRNNRAILVLSAVTIPAISAVSAVILSRGSQRDNMDK